MSVAGSASEMVVSHVSRVTVTEAVLVFAAESVDLKESKVSEFVVSVVSVVSVDLVDEAVVVVLVNLVVS